MIRRRIAVVACLATAWSLTPAPAQQPLSPEEMIAREKVRSGVEAAFDKYFEPVENSDDHLDNAWEAAQRNGVSPLQLSIVQFGSVLTVEDNAGGFDHANITKGRSTKKERGHGRFLYNLVNNPQVFNADVSFSDVKNGTRIALDIFPDIIVSPSARNPG